MIPNQLQLIINFLRNSSIEASGPINGENRIGSLKDEESIKKLLLKESSFKYCIKEPAPRHCGDILVKMNEIWQPVNIKTTRGTTDNATSKSGLIFSLTGLLLEEIPPSMTEKKMWELIRENKKEVEGKDYWYLTLDKKDMSQVRAYGLKQIKHWKSNPSNDLQIHWEKQWQDESDDLSFEEAYNLIEEKWEEICGKKLNSFDKDFLKKCLKKNLFLLNEILEEVAS